MPGVLPESLPGYAAVTALLRRLTERIRRLEAASALPRVPVMPAAGVSTTSTTGALLWRFGNSGLDDTVLEVQVLCSVSVAGAKGLLTITGENNTPLVDATVITGQAMTIRTPRPDAGPLVLVGKVSAGTLTVAVLDAYAPRYIDDPTVDVSSA